MQHNTCHFCIQFRGEEKCATRSIRIRPSLSLRIEDQLQNDDEPRPASDRELQTVLQHRRSAVLMDEHCPASDRSSKRSLSIEVNYTTRMSTAQHRTKTKTSPAQNRTESYKLSFSIEVQFLWILMDEHCPASDRSSKLSLNIEVQYTTRMSTAQHRTDLQT